MSVMRASRLAISAVLTFLGLFCYHARGVGAYLLRAPGAVDGNSLRLWLHAAALPALAALSLWAIGRGIGHAAIGRLGLRPTRFLDEVAVAALGLGVFAQAIFFLACVGWLRPGALLALTLAGSLVARAHHGAMPLARPASGGVFEGITAGLLAYAAACVVATALAPPIGWDVLAYHLALPERYLKADSWTPTSWMIHSHWPHLMEVFYSLPLALGLPGAAALVHAGAAGLLVAAVAACAGGGRASWTAALLLAAQPALLRSAGSAHADAASALFVFAGACSLVRWEESAEDGWLVVAGLLTGLAVSCKMLAFASLGMWTGALILKKRRAREALLFCGAGLMMIGPWLALTWRETGDPVWPFLRLGRESAELASRYLRSNRWSFPPSLAFFQHDGPLFLIVPALGGIVLTRGRGAAKFQVQSWLWIAAAGYVALSWRHNEMWRFLMPIWPVLALAAGGAAQELCAKGNPRKAAAALIALAGALPIVSLSANNALFAVLGLRSGTSPTVDPRVIFLERSVDVAAFYRQARGLLPSGARVLLFREVRGYGAGFDYLWGDPLNQALIDYVRIATPEELAGRLKALGVTHVLDHPSSHLYREDPGYYNARTLGLMADCLKLRARPVLVNSELGLYELL